MQSSDIQRLFRERGRKMVLKEGDVLFCQGEASDAVYFVIGGRLDVYAAQGSSEPVRINTVEAGEMVGELGAITRQQRTATLKAASQVELLSIATPDFRALLSDSLSLVEAMTLTNREHLMDADKARIQFGASNRQMQKRVARLGEEKEQLQSTVLSAAESVREIYKDIVIADAPSYSSGISEFTNEQRKTVVEQLGRSGLVSVEEDTNMQNPEKIEMFYKTY